MNSVLRLLIMQLLFTVNWLHLISKPKLEVMKTSFRLSLTKENVIVDLNKVMICILYTTIGQNMTIKIYT